MKLNDLLKGDKKIILVILFVAFGLYIFLEFSSEMAEGELTSIDNIILQALRNPHNPKELLGPKALLGFMQSVSSLGGVYALSAVSAVTALMFALKKKFRTCLLFILSVTSGSVIMVVLKYFFDRPRPSVVPHLGEFSLGSYPSGHSMVSALVYLTIGALLARSTKSLKTRTIYLSLSGVLVFLIGISRAFLGVHYPSDILAGWCAGVVWAAASYLLARFLLRKKNDKT
ncbi:phosphatase PAP2 family protein [bacterium]|nr:phosphatase PAP2 family protein [bacterium]